MDREVTVAAVMTAPRYECVAARNQIEKTLRQVEIPLTISGGVYYSQCMQIMLEDLVEKDVQYALTVDFDSVFTAAHVRRLVSLIAQERDIDALAAIQPMRGKGRVLASKEEETVVEWTGAPIRVGSAHFGLTVIDLAKLATVPKPWFCAAPDSEGRWGEGRIDADVSFWKAWTEAGHAIYIDPGSRLGHMEEMVTVFDQEMKPVHMYFNRWSECSEEMCD